MGPDRYFFSHQIVNVWSSVKCCSSAGVSVPELHRRRFLVRQRHRLDGRCALHHLPGGPGVQERWSVLLAERTVHHPARHRRVHGNQDPGIQREDPGACPACVRSDPLSVFQAANVAIKTKTIINQGIFVFFSGGGGGTIVIASTILLISTS